MNEWHDSKVVPAPTDRWILAAWAGDELPVIVNYGEVKEMGDVWVFQQSPEFLFFPPDYWMELPALPYTVIRK